MNLCSYCSRNYICGNQITQNYCTGFIKMEDTTWVDKLYQHEEKGELDIVISKLQKMQNAKQTNFEQIAKDEATLTDWLQEKMCFCTEIPCDECIAYKECWHQGNDTDYSNADLWNAWLKQPYKGE